MQLELDEYVSGGFAPAMMKLLHCISLIWFCLCFYSHSSTEAYLDPQNLSPLSAFLRIRFVIKLGYFRQLKEVVQNIVILGNDLQKVTDTSYKYKLPITVAHLKFSNIKYPFYDETDKPHVHYFKKKTLLKRLKLCAVL